MRMLSCFAVAALLVAGSIVAAAELKSGLQPGEAIGAFDVVKCAGAEKDGVDLGDQLCYRCKYGARPMVIVFARHADAHLGILAKRLDKVVAKHADQQLSAFINILGEDRDAAEAAAKEFAAAQGVENLPVVVPVEFTNGPADYGINPEAEVTIILAKNSKVVANHAFAAADLNEEALKAVAADMPKLLQ